MPHFSLPLSQKFVPVIGVRAIDQARRAGARLQKALTPWLGNTCLAHNADTGTVAFNQNCFADSIDIEAWMTTV
ncbi:hypothetical protein TU75_15155 [Pseudomonas poae]|nr:hypothetical protein TU75_15155 [Pseudomonas poae]